MHFHLSLVLLLFVFVSAFAAEKGSPCVTPNGETATCVSIDSCTVIKKAIEYLDKDAIAFAQKSQCGYDDSPLVCCGSVGGIASITSANPAPAVTATAASSVRPVVRITATATFTIKPGRKVTTKDLAAFDPPPVVVPIENVLLPDSSLCGIQIRENRRFEGEVAELNEFPWMAALIYTKRDGSSAAFRCGGTLINQRYILTAAHCLHIGGYNVTGVRLGEWRFSTADDCITDLLNGKSCTDRPLDLKVVGAIPHELYSKSNGKNDIALLRLEKEVKYTDFVRPICLPPADLPAPPVGTPVQISGWDITEHGISSDIKLKGYASLLPVEECAKAYPELQPIRPNYECARGQQGKNVCGGDSGGAVMQTYAKADTEEEQWYQEGIVHKGFGYSDKGVPGVYTRLSRYVKWILNNLK